MSGGEIKNTGMSPMGGMGNMGMVMPGMSAMGGMVMPGMGSMGLSPMSGMGSMGLGMPNLSPMSIMNSFTMSLPSSLSEIGASIEASHSSPAPKTNSRTQDTNLLSIAEVKEVPLSPNAKDNESIADNFKAMLQPQLKRDMTKILEEAEYGHESDSSYASSVAKEDVDSD